MLLSFLGSSISVYADSYVPTTFENVTYTYNAYTFKTFEPNVETVNYLVENSAGQAWLNSEDRCFRDCEVIIRETFTLSEYYTYNPSFMYMGWLNSTGNFTVSATKSASNTEIDSIVLISREHSFPYNFYSSTDSYNNTTVGSMLNMNFTRGESFNFYDLKVINTRYVENISKYIFRIYYHSNNKTAAGVTVSFNMGTTPTGQGNVIKYNSDSYYLFNNNENLKSLLNSVNNGNTTITGAINSAAATAHSDAQVAESQAAVQIDTITYDHSGSSAALATNAASIASEASAADVSFDSIMPNADSALATVAAFDATTFFNQQSSAANFWQQLGNYIMDSGQLGFVATGLVIVTLVSLFVFLLRF